MFKVLAMTKDYMWQCFLAESGEWDMNMRKFRFWRLGDGTDECGIEIVDEYSADELFYLQMDEHVLINAMGKLKAEERRYEVKCGDKGKILRFPLIQLEAVENKDTDNDKDE